VGVEDIEKELAAMTLKEAIIREIEGLPEPRQAAVLAFIRFPRAGRADEQTFEQRFVDAPSRARAIAQEQGISDQDISASCTKGC